MIEFLYVLSKNRQRAMVFAASLLPRRLVYWAMIRVGGEVTTGVWSNTIVPELTFIDALKRWSGEG